MTEWSLLIHSCRKTMPVTSVTEVLRWSMMRYINLRFGYLLTYLVTLLSFTTTCLLLKTKLDRTSTCNTQWYTSAGIIRDMTLNT